MTTTDNLPRWVRRCDLCDTAHAEGTDCPDDPPVDAAPRLDLEERIEDAMNETRAVPPSPSSAGGSAPSEGATPADSSATASPSGEGASGSDGPDLLPCPFCGGTDIEDDDEVVFCNDCNARVEHVGYTARFGWNTRRLVSPEATALKAEVAALRAEARRLTALVKVTDEVVELQQKELADCEARIQNLACALTKVLADATTAK